MPVVAHGRIVVWEGASLWLFESDDSSAKTDCHAHHAIQLTFALAGDFEFRSDDVVVRGPAAAVCADTHHDFSLSGTAAHLFIDPESRIGRALARDWFRDARLIAFDPLAHRQTLAALSNAFQSGSGDDAFVALGRQLVGEVGNPAVQRPIDPRVASMIDFATANLEDQATLAGAAAAVGLSKSRASHLFVEQTGMPLKSYILWRRLGCAVEQYAEGAPLTDAAHAAGFSDSAHLSRTFRRMFGLTAASLRVMRTA